MSISLKVKLYGESYKIHRLHINVEHAIDFKRVASQLGEPIETAMLNINFFKNLGIKEINSIQDLSQSNFGGLINNERSQVELWLGRRRLVKIKLENLFRHQTLFPLYQTQNSEVNKTLKSGLYFEEREIGNIGIYEIKIEKFEIANLKFHLSKISFTQMSYELLNELSYQGQSLNLTKSDTLLRHQMCFLK